MNVKTENQLILILTIIACAIGAFFGIHQLIDYYQSAPFKFIAIAWILGYLCIVPIAFYAVAGIVIRAIIWGLSVFLNKTKA